MVFLGKSRSTRIGRHKAAIPVDSATVKLLSALIVIVALCDLPVA